MRLETIFQVSIYGLVSLAGVSLALAEGSPLPAFTLPIALLALFFSERRRSVGLPQLWANVLGLLALGAAGLEFISGHAEARLLSGAHFLVYLSWIALYQSKTIQLYWWMCALSVLQMAVGSVLLYEPLYGWLLVAYLVAAVWTLSVFSLFQAEQQYAGTDDSDAEEGEFDAARVSSTRFRSTGSAGLSPGSLLSQSTTARGEIQLDPSAGWINVPFMLGMLITAAWSLLIAAAFFLLIPRLWLAYRPMSPFQPADAQRTLTGFTKEVHLGDLGQILESTDSVLAARFYDNETGEELDVEDYAIEMGYDEPLFRGAVLGTYENGRWKPGSVHTAMRDFKEVAPTRSVRQELTRQPIGTDVVFAMHPVLACEFVDLEKREWPRFADATFKIYQSDGEAVKVPLKYVAYSPKPDPDQPAAEFPVVRGLSRAENLNRIFRNLPEEGLERLKAKAQEIVGTSSDKRESASLLVDYLRDSGDFTYTLDASIIDAEIDPVEDFLFNRRSGHCEYYASALALMLRAVGIPSRLVSGFKGGDRNMFNGNFEVQQRHAHAWVEARINRQWVTLDATPVRERTLSVQQMASGPASWRDFMSISSASWKRYVVNLNYVQQYTTFYGPMQRAGRTAWGVVAGNDEEASTAWSAVVDFVTSPSRWFSWQGLVVTLILGTTVSFLVWITRKAWHRFSSVWSRRQRRQDHRVQVEFYERFKKLCAATGLTREPGQTQREFAVDVHRSWNEALGPGEVDGFPARLVESFYRVRFGRTPIDRQLADEIDSQLSRLEDVLPARRRR